VGFLRRLFGEEDAAEQARRDAAEQGEAIDTSSFGPPPGIPGVTGDQPWENEVEVDDDDPAETVVRFPAPNLDPDSLQVERGEGNVTIRASASSSERTHTDFLQTLELPEEIDAAQVAVDAEPDMIVVRIPKT
jgi:HSP20 family molecular chaperone IbpA